MAGRLEGKVTLVTGSTSGIGEAIARGYAAEGASVVVSGRRVSQGQAVVESIRAGGGEATFVACDVTKSADVAALVAGTVTAYGRLDVGVNNAGVGGDNAKLADLADDVWDQIIAINLRGVFLGMKHEIQQFLKQGGGGAIVNMGSVLGHVAVGERGDYSLAPYIAAKHGIEGLTKCATADYGALGIRTNTLAPGLIATEATAHVMAQDLPVLREWVRRTSMGRLASVQDVVGAAVFLASDDSRYVSGISLPVDGGYLAV